MHPLNFNLILFPLKFYKKKLLSTKSSYFTDMLGSYGISSNQTYKLSFILVGKTQIKHLPDQPDLDSCSLFANFFQHSISSISNVLPNINSTRLNLNLTSNQNHCSCFSLHTHDSVLFLVTSLKPNSPLILFHSIYFIHYHHILWDTSLKLFIDFLYHILFHTQ